MSVFDIEAALAAPAERGAPRLLGSYSASGPSMVGTLTIPADSNDDSWERHDGGDELIVILRGRATFTIRLPDGTTEVAELGPGQAVLIPRGAAHSGHVAEDVHVFFLTPSDGNVTWTDAETGARGP